MHCFYLSFLKSFHPQLLLLLINATDILGDFYSLGFLQLFIELYGKIEKMS